MGRSGPAGRRRSLRILLVVAMVATLVAALPASSHAAPGDSPRPTWPDTASITKGVITATTAALSWPAAHDDGTVVRYNLYGGVGNTELLGTTTSTSIVLAGLDAGSDYTVHVEAVDDDGNESEPLTGTHFSVPMKFATGVDANPHSIDLAHLDPDGHIDIAVANKSTSAVGVLLGNGDGTFDPVSNYSVETHMDGSGPKNLDVGDFDADNDLDIVVANQDSGDAAVILNDGSGAFGAVTRHVTSVGTHDVVVANLNPGTDPDFVTVGWEGVDASSYTGGNGSTFAGPVDFNVGLHGHGVLVADFDNDTNLDLGVAANGISSATVLKGNGDGTFVQPPLIYDGPPVTEGSGAHDIAVGDFDEDGDEDLVIASELIDSLSVFYGLSPITMAFDDDEDVYVVADEPKGVSVGDVNNDGHDDLIAASVRGHYTPEVPATDCPNTPGGDPLTLLLGDGARGFSHWDGTYGVGSDRVASVNGQILVGTAPFDAVVYDLNGDGWNDIAAPGWCTDDVTVFLGLGVGGPGATFSTTADVPGPPAAPTVVPGNGFVELSWTVPASDGGSAVTGYKVEVENTTTPGTTTEDVGLVLTDTATGLSKTDTYRARVIAYNTIGDGAWSAWSASFVPGDGPPPPPPSDNPFTDTDGSVFRDDIIWLADQGITKGCNPPTNDLFCPDDDVTRGQMAAFLVRALGLTDDGGGNTFVDVPAGSVFEADIAKLAAAGITKGCNPPTNTNFCPDDEVTRGQMAAFMVRALGLTDDGGGNTFVDVPAGSVFENDIAKLATAGITKGCNPPTNTNFCPDDNVTRGQMAAFMRRALGRP